MAYVFGIVPAIKLAVSWSNLLSESLHMRFGRSYQKRKENPNQTNVRASLHGQGFRPIRC